MSKGFLKLIVATDEEGGIGKDGDLAWHCKEDLQLFKKKTEGCYIIMGRKTLESLPKGKPLPNRINVVLSREVPEKPVTGVFYFQSVEDVLEFVEGENAWVIGGEQIYKEFLPHASEIHETDIAETYCCDKFFKMPISELHLWSPEETYPVEFKDTIVESVTIWKRNKPVVKEFKLCVLESPYAGNVEANEIYARLCMHDMLLRKEAPYASHLLYTQPLVLDDTIPEERDLGIKAGFAFKHMEGMHTVFYTDLGMSKGMELALEYIKENGMSFEMRTLPNYQK